MKTNYSQFVAWYECLVKPFIKTPHSQPTRCGYATIKRPPKPFEWMEVRKDETVPERDFNPKKRPRIDEEETENINISCHISNQSETIEANGLEIDELSSLETIYYDAPTRVDTLLNTLEQVFGMTSWVTNQYESVCSALKNEDIFTVLPAGKWRNVCYQLPALKSCATTVVLMPQLAYVEYFSIPAFFFLNQPTLTVAGTVSADDLLVKIKEARLLYITYMDFHRHKSLFKEISQQGQIVRFVLDDAHFLSQWHEQGHVRYAKAVENLRQDFPSIPITALTAIPNERIYLDILHLLGIHTHCKVYKQSILFYCWPFLSSWLITCAMI
ncbi:hypothetical protein BCV71DRAFT_181170 [Rhizopus microsporus]|uniref:Helicase ATP-binding domain-containing protein n=1 Tax=Rhizopus microsporus TaxID=58291 RepID=A0A1X0S0D5_RHIZD|nr:hypothetical protein BCV71DRAFT_181170 [Rhizopus microsporus]